MKKVFFYFLVLFVLAFPVKAFSAEAPRKEVHIIRIDDQSINPVTADYIISSIGLAEISGAELLVIELDTPGGLLQSTRKTVKRMLASTVPICVYVYPAGARAGSAGVFIVYASNIAAMSPSTNMGAAHPVSMGGSKRKSITDAIYEVARSLRSDKEEKEEKETDEPRDIMTGKVLNDTVAFIKAIARKRGRNAEWAEKSVTESASVTDEEARRLGVIDLAAKDEKDLLTKLNGMKVSLPEREVVLDTGNAMIKRRKMDLRQNLLNIIANPNIAYILLMLGFYGLLFEVTHPGIGFPGIAGMILIILAFFSMQMLPTNYAGVALLALGVVLFIAEVKVPGFGLLTLGGLVCMVLGSLILFDTQQEIMRVSFSLILSAALVTCGVTLILVRAVVISHRHKVISGREGLIEARGEAEVDFENGRGKVFVHGEIWNAVADGQIKKGEKVVVTDLEGMDLKVKKN